MVQRSRENLPVDVWKDLLKGGASNPEVRPLPGSRRHDKCWPEAGKERGGQSTSIETAQLELHVFWLEWEVSAHTYENREARPRVKLSAEALEHKTLPNRNLGEGRMEPSG